MTTVHPEAGSQALADARHEAFAQKLAAGDPLNSWADTADPDHRPSLASAKASGWRVAHRPEVRARVEWLQCLARPDPQRIDKDAASLLREIASVLRETADAFDFLPLQKRANFRAICAKNLARLDKLQEPPQAKPEQQRTEIFDRIHECTCPT